MATRKLEIGFAAKSALMAAASGTEEDLQKQGEKTPPPFREVFKEFSDTIESLQREDKWLFSPNMQFLDYSNKAKCFLRNVEAPRKGRRVREDGLKVLHHQRLRNGTTDRLDSYTRPSGPIRNPLRPPLPNPEIPEHPHSQQAYDGHSAARPPPLSSLIDLAKTPTPAQQAGFVPVHYSEHTAQCPNHLVDVPPSEHPRFVIVTSLRTSQAAELDGYLPFLQYGSPHLQALGDEYDKKIHACGSRKHSSAMSSYAIPSIKYMPPGRDVKTRGFRILKSIWLPLGGLAVCLPCATALLNGSNWPGSVRGITGVISGSSGLSLTSLPIEENYNALRWLVRLLWVVTYGAFLRSSYLSLRDNRPIYLFCSLLLAAHFVFGFAGAADTTEEATKGILMFGPLVATLCTALVYIPFRYRATNAASGSDSSRSVGDVETPHSGRSSPVPAQRNDGDGDLSQGWRVMQGMMGPVV